MLTNSDLEAACEASIRNNPSPADDPDVQEALSKRYAPDVVRILRLRSGRFAVFNHAGELCGITDKLTIYYTDMNCFEWPPAPWHPFQPAQSKPVDLEELGLL